MNRLKHWTVCKALLVLVTISSFGAFAQVPTPGNPQEKSILIVNGIAHLGTGKAIQKSAIGFSAGKINLVSDLSREKVDRSQFDTVIDIAGKHVYPGFIAVNSTLGLQEIDAVRATRDSWEIGSFNPHIRSIIAYNTDSKITPTVRTNGVLHGQICPRGNLVSGSSSIVHFDAWNWEDAIVKQDEGIHVSWPDEFSFSGPWYMRGELKKSKSYKKKKLKIDEFFRAAAAYCNEEAPNQRDLRFEAMRGVFAGESTVYVHANSVRELMDVASLKAAHNLKRLTIVGGYDSWRITQILKAQNIGVMVKRVHALPNLAEEDIDLPYKLPNLLYKAGVSFCLESSGGMEQMNSRNIPFWAGTAVAYGLPYEQAIASISYNAAKLMGVDDRIGAIKVGLDATLFVSAGDALDMRTNQVSLAFVQGRKILLDNHQIQLYKKYRKKYGLSGD